jgi:two-component system response regulator AlgR
MKVLIVDDEQLARDRLSRMLKDMEGIDLSGEAANGMDALRQCESGAPDLVLLDIRMPGMDGLEAARHMMQLDEPPAVVFCTAYEEHAIEAFNVQAVGYLLKPVRKNDLATVLSNAKRTNKAQLAALAESEGTRRTHISARTHRGIELVPIEDVLCLQADQKYVTVKHTGGELLIDEPLRDLELEFGDLFVRVHRNALVAVRYIEGLDRDADGGYRIRITDTEPIEISRRHVAAVRRFVKAL